MTATIHSTETSPVTIEATRREDAAWFSIYDGEGNQMTVFFRPAAIAHIMGQMEKALGELETIAAHLDRGSDAELAPAGVSEQDGVRVDSLAGVDL